MAQTAAAYQLPSSIEPQSTGPQLRSIPGRGHDVATAPAITPWVRTAIIMSAVLVVVLATASVGRISISNLTVQLMLQAEQTKQLISDARSAGAALEVTHSLATNPNRIQDAASVRGVVPGNQPVTIAARHGFAPDTQFQMAAAAAEQTKLAVDAEAVAIAEAEAAAATAADAEANAEAASANTNAEATADDVATTVLNANANSIANPNG